MRIETRKSVGEPGPGSRSQSGSRGRWNGWLWLALIVAVGAALRIHGLGSEPFWLDEAHSANLTKLSIPELLSWTDPFDRGNPPGYFLLLKLWVQVSRSDVWMRTLSAVAGVLTLPVVYLVGLRLYTRRIALIATAFLAVAGYHIRFSQETRVYALMGLVGAGVMLAVAQLITQPDGDRADRLRGDRPWVVKEAGLGLRRPLTWTDVAWAAYTLLAGVAFLLHATGIGMAVAANIVVASWWFGTRPRPPRFARNWIVANLGVLFIWMAWIPGFLRQIGPITERWWVPEPTFLTVMEGGADLVAPTFQWRLPWNGQTLGAAALVVFVLILIGIGLRGLTRERQAMIWAFLLTLPVIELVYSLNRPIFLTRTLVWIMMPLALGLALAAARPRRLWPATTALLLVLSLTGGMAYHATYEKTAWDEAASLVADTADTRDLVLVQPTSRTVGFNHYFEATGLQPTIYGVPSRLPNRSASGPVVVASDREEVAALASSFEEVWLILNRPPAGESLEPTLNAVAATKERHRLTDLVVIHYTMP